MKRTYECNLAKLETATLRRQAGVPPGKCLVDVENLRLLIGKVKELEKLIKREGMRI